MSHAVLVRECFESRNMMIIYLKSMMWEVVTQSSENARQYYIVDYIVT